MSIIGTTTTYTGTEHSFLRGCEVKILAVHKGMLVNEDDYEITRSDEGLAAAGGVDPDTDLIEVAPVHADGRVSFVTSDARVTDLALFQQG